MNKRPARVGRPIDSLYFMERNSVIGPREGLRATIDTRDPAGRRNYMGPTRRRRAPHHSRQRLQGPRDRQRRPGSREAGEASSSPTAGSPVAPGQVVTVRQIALSDAGYRYYVALTDQVVNDGSPLRGGHGQRARATSPAARARRGAR
ncbi:MAG: hypothetical protein IPK33_23630 [Gemmatimonadetes bacterium]|nr:hypothetical protein [Gemmatimonadota bacterium]